MKILKVINKDKTYMGKDGKEHYDVTYYLLVDVCGQPKYIAIDPHFKESKRDWYLLDTIAERRIIDSKAEKKTVNE